MGISNLSTGLRPGVCTSTTRPSTPFEGQMIYETDTDLTYIYGGSAWQQVSGGTAVGNSGLVYITGGTQSGSTALNVDNCFTSTYRNYRIVMSNIAVETAGRALRINTNARNLVAREQDQVGATTLDRGHASSEKTWSCDHK